ncbi:MAG: SPOR domain-containing protein [Acidobacteriota bacterium]
MKPRFRPREALLLYLVLLVCVAVLFLVGLELGRDRMTAASAAPARGTVAPPEPASNSADSPVELYENLTAPSPSPVEPTPSRTASADVPSDEPAAEAEPTKPSPPVSKPAVPAGSSAAEQNKTPAQYTIQVAAHSSRQEAEQTLLRLGAKGFTGRIQEPKAGTGDRFYRVWVGAFDTLEQARAQEAEVKAAGFLTYVRKIE